ncbi:DUF6985 domain-containing protein [Flavobacterium sp. 3HN19-14]|uniref:DUF6985 domain-containing protein n=1 Tax=Flavobacterium sp. 3HN19-14 TaxID=3448133 RepID=UPI003EE1E665
MKKNVRLFVLNLIIGTSIVIFSCGNLKSNEKTLSTEGLQKQDTEIRSKIKSDYLSKKDIDVIFWKSKGEISEKQKENLLEFVKREKELSEKIKLAIFEYYKSVYNDYRKGIDLANMEITKEQLEEILPTPTTPEMLFKSYEIATIHIQDDKNCKFGTIGLEFDCDWDIENGLGVKIENWEIKEVGIAETSYY